MALVGIEKIIKKGTHGSFDRFYHYWVFQWASIEDKRLSGEHHRYSLSQDCKHLLTLGQERWCCYVKQNDLQQHDRPKTKKLKKE